VRRAFLLVLVVGAVGPAHNYGSGMDQIRQALQQIGLKPVL
jgi:hypothetical protein